MDNLFNDEYVIALTQGSNTLEQNVSHDIPFLVLDVYETATIASIDCFITSKSGRDSSVIQSLTPATQDITHTYMYTLTYTPTTLGIQYIHVKITTDSMVHWSTLEPYTIIQTGV